MPYADINEILGAKVPKPFERELKFIMSPETHKDVQGFSLLVATLAPNGGCTDLHSHKDSGELMIFMTGKGKAWLAGEEYPLKPGAVIYAPPGVEHKTMNTGDEPLSIACVFVPPVPVSYIENNIRAAGGKLAGE